MGYHFTKTTGLGETTRGRSRKGSHGGLQSIGNDACEVGWLRAGRALNTRHVVMLLCAQLCTESQVCSGEAHAKTTRWAIDDKGLGGKQNVGSKSNKRNVTLQWQL